MIIIPAIDIMDGCCVRLSQGEKDHKTVYSDDPLEVARGFVSQGARRLHIVDLDGAFRGEPTSFDAIAAILREVEIPIEIGGGIRSVEIAERYLAAGANWVIIGTQAVTDPQFVSELAAKYRERVLVGIDAKDGRVMVRGWVDESAREAHEMALDMQERGAAGIIYTDIKRDGMLVGPNIDATCRLAESLHIPVVASGGVSAISQLLDLKARAASGVVGAICGRSLYDNCFTVAEAVAALS